ncbi:Imm49 family immunity protein [Streptomyces yangpuensis]|uniref:Imm49 family immunity protein n=1 Tax=Streptomyces yangpuensis TaxID=1648182 RepID=UPI003642E4CA
MMLYRFLRKDPADEDRRQNIHGVVAVAPPAIACLAKANGLPVELETDSLPQALLDFAWRGEFDA